MIKSINFFYLFFIFLNFIFKRLKHKQTANIGYGMFLN